MNTPFVVTDEILISELWARDVRFLMGEPLTPQPTLEPVHLIVALAQSHDARLRMALIPLFLRHPEFSKDVIVADERLSPAEQLYLRFYYTAAVLLQKKHRERLMKIFGKQPPLPDLFSEKLGFLPGEDIEESLARLGKHHQTVSGQIINWFGTYEHAAEVWLKQMELQKG